MQHIQGILQSNLTIAKGNFQWNFWKGFLYSKKTIMGQNGPTFNQIPCSCALPIHILTWMKFIEKINRCVEPREYFRTKSCFCCDCCFSNCFWIQHVSTSPEMQQLKTGAGCGTTDQKVQIQSLGLRYFAPWKT